MRQMPLLTLHEVVVRDAGGAEIGPIDWSIHRAERVWVDFADELQFSLLANLLSGRAKPASGYIEEGKPVRVQSDLLLRESTNLNRSISEYLHSSDAPEFVWLESRRRPVQVLLDRLGLTANRFRLPLKFQPADVIEKFVAFRFIISRADLLIGRDLFAARDPNIAEVLRMRWADFPGVVIAGTAREKLPGVPDVHVTLAIDGTFSRRPHEGS